MTRRLMLVALAAAIVLAVPSAAFAKGEMQAVDGQAVITGPGLPGPVELTGQVSGSEGFLWGADQPTEFSTFVTATPLMAGDASLGWFELAPDDLAALGPGYTVRLRFAYADGTASSLQSRLYPYAEGGPLMHVPADQALLGRHIELWWRASSGSMVTVLRAHGLPAEPPVVDAPPAAPAPAAVPTAGPSWIWAMAAGGLLALVLAGVAGGRRRSAMGRV
jgi:hypothetical protein